MRRHMARGLMVLLASCGARISGASNDANSGDASSSDATPCYVDDARIEAPMHVGPLSPPLKTVAVSTTADDDDVTLSSNALEMIYAVAKTSGKNLFYTSRTSKLDPWMPPMVVSFNDPTAS